MTTRAELRSRPIQSARRISAGDWRFESSNRHTRVGKSSGETARRSCDPSRHRNATEERRPDWIPAPGMGNERSGEIDSPAAGAPREIAWLAKLWADIRVWRWAAGVLATLSPRVARCCDHCPRPARFFRHLDCRGRARRRTASGLGDPARQRRASDCRRHSAGRAGSAGTRLSAVALGRGPDRAASARSVAAVRAQAHCRLAGECAPVGRHRRTRRYARTRRRLAKSRAERPAGVSRGPRESGLNAASPSVNFQRMSSYSLPEACCATVIRSANRRQHG